MTTTSRVLVLGATHAANQQVAEAVLKKIDTSKDTIAWSKVERESSFLSHGVIISTKYYTAPVEFDVHADLCDDWASYEACLLIWDPSDKASWARVQDTVERMEDHSFDALLAISTSSVDGTMSLQNTLDWCLDHGVEHVALERAESEDPASNDEATGIDRVVEALQCTMWKSMEVKANSSSDVAPTPAPQAAPPVAENPPVTEAMFQPSSNNVDEDATNFESLLQEVQSIRAQLNREDVSDDQRRARAADMAMRLWNLLGEDDDCDSD
ncbi:hypothetical protein LEN26_006110 [Aphanomyces euteiches]|nr:hypothetical protein LEN26_006110 [Aphanomyces euteiches]